MSESHDFEQTLVPEDKRRGFWSMFVVMLGFTFFSASMWTGANLGAGLTLKGFFLYMLIGNLVLGLYTSMLAWIASSTGLSIHLLARQSFGRRGSALPSFLLAFTQIGWFGVGIAMFAIPVQAYLKEKGIECNIWLPVLISGLLMTSTAYWGIRALTVISIIAVPAVALGGGFSAIKVFVDNPDAWSTLNAFTPAPDKALTFSGAVALTVGSFISGGSCTPDFVRFAKTRAIAVSTTAIAFFIGNSIMFLFGAIGGMFYQTNDISNVLVAQGLLIPGIIVLGFNIWTTNDNALYTSGLGLANITGLPKRYLVLANGVIGTLLAVWLYNNFCGWLSLLNTFLPSIGAIIAADFFLVRRYKADPEQAPANGIPAIIAWLAGTATANFIHWGITAINGMIVAAVVYTLLAIALAPKKQD
ncbi:MAG: cytosine permease [Oligosphaeraceae bacterium]